ncbi:MAG: cobyric acid synthase, partial [Victivallaceae bacterium]
KFRQALITTPSYIDYENSCRLAGMEIEYAPMEVADQFTLSPEKLARQIRPDMLVFIGQPGNPAGMAIPADELRMLAAKFPDTVFVIDEAFADFLDDEFSLLPEVPENVIVLHSLTKFFAVPGLRIGLCFASEKNTAAIRAQIPDWSVNSLAQAVGVKLLRDSAGYIENTIETISRLRAKLIFQLLSIDGLKVFPGMANYLLIKRMRPDRNFYFTLLKEHHIAVRDCSNFKGLDESYFRVGVKTEAENDFLVAALKSTLGAEKKPETFYFPKHRRKPSLMIQGTCSDAGKSILTSAFCRILLQDGYDVAPFKSQNMALNSYVTVTGGEMGRAQAVQAEACRLDPDVRMNPVLLKPSTDVGCQVIVLGQPVENMKVKQYFSAKKELFNTVKSTYDSLERDHEVIVLEGAGSPGEMNLKDSDIVNMNMARYAESPVLLTGDIDRGGVYASFIGTVATFEPWERELLKGFLVNKFRGDASLLASAHEYVSDFTGKPVLGVIPYIHDLGLPEEDSVAFSFTRPCKKMDKTLDVALVGLNHIANFTDFTPFEIEPDVNVRKIRKLEELGSPDVIILPGSKNVLDDFAHIRKNGLAQAIMEHVRSGGWLVGVCGGLQMAGQVIEDPHGLESHLGSIDCLGLMPLRTVLHKEKCLKQTTGTLLATGSKVSGYEIHHGITETADEKLVSMVSNSGDKIGFASGRVWLTYLHGVFDDDGFRREFIDMLRVDRGLPPLKNVQANYNTENAFNRLAAVVRESVDMKSIYRIMGLK